MIQTRRPGFTILEMTISLGIMVLLSTLVIVYSNRGFETDLNTAAAEVAQVLRDARERTLASRGTTDGNVWGVDFGATTYSLYYGAHPGTVERTYSLPQNLQFSTATQADNVEFTRLTGKTVSTNDHTVTIEQTGSSSESIILYISDSGAVGTTDVVDPSAPTNIDSRFIKVTNGVEISAGEDVVVTFFDASNDPLGSPHTLPVDDNLDQSSNYFVYSGNLDAGGTDYPVDIVIEKDGGVLSTEYYVYYDAENYSSVGIKVSGDGTPVAEIDYTGAVTLPVSSNDYEKY